MKLFRVAGHTNRDQYFVFVTVADSAESAVSKVTTDIASWRDSQTVNHIDAEEWGDDVMFLREYVVAHEDIYFGRAKKPKF